MRPFFLSLLHSSRIWVLLCSLAFQNELFAQDHVLVVSKSGPTHVAFETAQVDSVTFRPRADISLADMYDYQASRGVRSLKMLVIGNSYSCNTYDYVPFLLKSILPDIEVVVGILYYSGASLSRHQQNFEDGSRAYAYYKNTNGGIWEEGSEMVSIQTALTDEKWDLLMFQQSSGNAADYSTYQPYLDNLIAGIYEVIGYPIQLGWMSVHSRSTDSPDLAFEISQCGKRVVDESLIDFMIPVSTAIENARATALVSGGIRMTADGAHLAEGIPCQIAAYTVVLSLLKQMGMGYKSIYGEPTRVNSIEWVMNRHCPLPTFYEKDVIPMTDAACRIAQQCAIMAVKHPDVITQIAP